MESVTQMKVPVSVLGEFFFESKRERLNFISLKEHRSFKCSAEVVASFCVFVLVDKSDNILNKRQLYSVLLQIRVLTLKK